MVAVVKSLIVCVVAEDKIEYPDKVVMDKGEAILINPPME